MKKNIKLLFLFIFINLIIVNFFYKRSKNFPTSFFLKKIKEEENKKNKNEKEVSLSLILIIIILIITVAFSCFLFFLFFLKINEVIKRIERKKEYLDSRLEILKVENQKNKLYLNGTLEDLKDQENNLINKIFRNELLILGSKLYNLLKFSYKKISKSVVFPKEEKKEKPGKTQFGLNKLPHSKDFNIGFVIDSKSPNEKLFELFPNCRYDYYNYSDIQQKVLKEYFAIIKEYNLLTLKKFLKRRKKFINYDNGLEGFEYLLNVKGSHILIDDFPLEDDLDLCSFFLGYRNECRCPKEEGFICKKHPIFHFYPIERKTDKKKFLDFEKLFSRLQWYIVQRTELIYLFRTFQRLRKFFGLMKIKKIQAEKLSLNLLTMKKSKENKKKLLDIEERISHSDLSSIEKFQKFFFESIEKLEENKKDILKTIFEVIPEEDRKINFINFLYFFIGNLDEWKLKEIKEEENKELRNFAMKYFFKDINNTEKTIDFFLQEPSIKKFIKKEDLSEEKKVLTFAEILKLSKENKKYSFESEMEKFVKNLLRSKEKCSLLLKKDIKIV